LRYSVQHGGGDFGAGWPMSAALAGMGLIAVKVIGVGLNCFAVFQNSNPAFASGHAETKASPHRVRRGDGQGPRRDQVARRSQAPSNRRGVMRVAADFSYQSSGVKPGDLSTAARLWLRGKDFLMEVDEVNDIPDLGGVRQLPAPCSWQDRRDRGQIPGDRRAWLEEAVIAVDHPLMRVASRSVRSGHW